MVFYAEVVTRNNYRYLCDKQLSHERLFWDYKNYSAINHHTKGGIIEEEISEKQKGSLIISSVIAITIFSPIFSFSHFHPLKHFFVKERKTTIHYQNQPEPLEIRVSSAFITLNCDSRRNFSSPSDPGYPRGSRRPWLRTEDDLPASNARKKSSYNFVFDFKYSNCCSLSAIPEVCLSSAQANARW